MARPCLPPVFRFGRDPWDPSNRFQSSWLLPPWALFFCRALIALYCFTTLFFVIGYSCSLESRGGCTAARRSFSYFTVLAYWGQAFYFLVAAIHTFSYAARARPWLAHLPRPLQALHSLFYTTVITLPLLVTIVYWAVLFRGPWFPLAFGAWSNISQHALNSLFALFEIFFPRTAPPPWIHLLWLILILAGYLAVAYITYADQGWYTYNFLDYESVGGRGIVAAYIFGIAAAIIVIFCIVTCLVRLRLWVTEAKLDMRGKLAHPPRQYDDAEMNPITPQLPPSKR